MIGWGGGALIHFAFHKPAKWRVSKRHISLHVDDNNCLSPQAH